MTTLSDPFGPALYKRQASSFVLPYPLLVFIVLFIPELSATYWSISAATADQRLRQFHIPLARRNFFEDHWFQLGTLYGVIACGLIIVLNIQAGSDSLGHPYEVAGHW